MHSFIDSFLIEVDFDLNMDFVVIVCAHR